MENMARFERHQSQVFTVQACCLFMQLDGYILESLEALHQVS